MLAALTAASALGAASPAFGHATAPAGLTVTRSTTTSVKVDWRQDYADSYSGYYVRVDGGSRVSFPTSDATISNLQPGTRHEVCVTINFTSASHPDESDPACITATTAVPTPTPTPTLTPTPTPTPDQPRGIWAEVHKVSDAGLAQIKALGFDFVWSRANTADLDRVHRAGLQAAVWLGKWYDDDDTDGTPCTWEKSDATIAGLVNAVKDHPAVAYYFVDDEPHDLCANVRREFMERNALIKSIDGAHPTFVTENRTQAFDSLANVTDILAMIGYPCNWSNVSLGCSQSNIRQRIDAARAAGVAHYWSVSQVFEEPRSCDGYYTVPTPAAYASIISQWRAGGVEGDFAFMWNRVYSCGVGLAEHPELWDVVAAANG